MEMTRFEKFFVNRERKGLGNLRRVQRVLTGLDTSHVIDVLEIGCGIGTVSARLADATGWNVTGTDDDATQIEEAKSRYPESGGLRFRREDATRLSFADGSFDVAIAQMVFHHLGDWPAAVRELARVVRGGGTVIWQDLVFSQGVMRVAWPAARWFGICGRESVAATFTANGFEIVSARPSHAWPVSFTELIVKRQ